jgi:hypothetical protein
MPACLGKLAGNGWGKGGLAEATGRIRYDSTDAPEYMLKRASEIFQGIVILYASYFAYGRSSSR